jgi:tRNA (guanine-N7-)-methyltransferase
LSRRKSVKYQLATDLENVIQRPKPFFDKCKGKWKSDYFQNSNPIVLELGCGKGEYSNGLAKLFPDKNFIGIDVKGDRLASAGLFAQRSELKNVVFLRLQIQFILDFFEIDEVDEIWITFPDPRPRDRDEKKRLTNPYFLEKYKEILKPNGLLHLKTDSESLFDYSLETIPAQNYQLIEQTKDLYQSDLNKDHFGIKTRFEELFFNKGFSIKYLRAVNNK